MIQNQLIEFDLFNSLRIFIRIAHEGSFRRASERLGIAPSSVTKELKKLEEHLGVNLFFRTTRKISLTEEGKIFLSDAKSLISSLEEAELNIHQRGSVTRGHLRITAPAILGQRMLSGLVAEFQKENPYVDVELVLTDRVIDIVEEGFDLSFRTSFGLGDSGLYQKNLGEISRVVCASPEYLEKFGHPKRITDLAKHNSLVFIRGTALTSWRFNKGRKELNIPINGNYKTNNLMALIEAVKRGLGIANIPRYLVEEEIKSGELESLFNSYRLPAYSVFLLYHQKRSQSRKLDRFISFFEKNLTGL